MKFLNESLLQNNTLDRLTIDFEKILLKISQDHYNIDKFKMNYIFEIIFGHSVNEMETLDFSLIENKDESFLILLINLCIKTQNEKLIQLFIENDGLKSKLNLNASDKNDEFPVFTAYSDYVNNNKLIGIRIFDLILQKGADCNSINKNGTPLLSLALKDKNYLKIKILLEQQALKFDLGSPTKARHPIIEAIFQNDLQHLKFIMDESEDNDHDFNPIDQESPKSFSFSPLVLAYLLNSWDIFHYLVNYYDIDQLDHFGYSLLHYAILKKDLSTVTYLVEHGANVNYYKNKNHCGNSAVDIALFIKDKDILNVVLSSQELLLNIPNHYDETPLITVIKIDHYSVEEKINAIRNLVSQGADINYTNSYENFPLLYAIYEKSLPLVTLLLDMGVDVNLHDDNSPLISAVEVKSYSIVKFLLDNGADVNFADQTGYTALIYSLEKNNLPIVKLLVEYGANINEVIENEYGQEMILLTLAIRVGDLEIIHYLMECHAEISFEHEYTYNHLINDVYKHGNFSLFKDLANYHLNHFSSHLIETIIYGSLPYDKLELLKTLVDLHFDINVKDVNGNTPLMYAIKINHGPIANFLIDHGASVNEVNHYGDSIYDLSYRASDNYWGQKIYHRIKTILQK